MIFEIFLGMHYVLLGFIGFHNNLNPQNARCYPYHIISRPAKVLVDLILDIRMFVKV
jgi:hypothetical protein